MPDHIRPFLMSASPQRIRARAAGLRIALGRIPLRVDLRDEIMQAAFALRYEIAALMLFADGLDRLHRPRTKRRAVA
ncbi:MAG: hypothetical protein KF822_12450 [Steroidobacteraceae bacterium]|nr:hypothetical protein [Steroidobacteraceae bacterium]